MALEYKSGNDIVIETAFNGSLGPSEDYRVKIPYLLGVSVGDTQAFLDSKVIKTLYEQVELRLKSSAVSTDTSLGGTGPSDLLASSQKAIKSYVDLQKFSGPTGPTGPLGPTGVGNLGPRGPNGLNGPTGPTGASAYESALLAGYTGSESYFNNNLSELGRISSFTETEWEALTADQKSYYFLALIKQT